MRQGRQSLANTLQPILIVPDTHAPYHDQRAWDLMLKAARALKPHTVIHMGDLADFYAVSSHSKDPQRALQLKDELEVAKRLRADLDALKPVRKVFIEGNHCDRLTRYLRDRAPELHELIDVRQLLELTDNAWEFVPYKDYIQIGHVYFTHDTGNSGSYTTKRAMDAFQHSVVIGHHHSMAYIVEGDATGKHMVAAQFGWLGDENNADYMQRVKARRKWSLGFGIGYHDPRSGYIYLQPVPIVDYTCCVGGKLFRV
jgi:predicted phosphodiesterase